MRSLGLGRYSLEWLGLLVLFGVIGVLVARDAAPGPGVGLVLAALSVVASLDLMVYVVVGRGLLEDPQRFMSWWGLSLILKFFVLGATVIAVLVLRVEGHRVFLLTLGTALPLFTIHQVVRLVTASDRLSTSPLSSGGGEAVTPPLGSGGSR